MPLKYAILRLNFFLRRLPPSPKILGFFFKNAEICTRGKGKEDLSFAGGFRRGYAYCWENLKQIFQINYQIHSEKNGNSISLKSFYYIFFLSLLHNNYNYSDFQKSQIPNKV